ncbi:Ubiquitin-conjugating enzyme E2-binding protein [Trinorchestia longiramus]|nr:Ubiquitin-conjugating enzyme E2-binding protein [Trinorchestia longiramus]
MVSSTDIPITVEVLSSLQLCNVHVLWPDVVEEADVSVTTGKTHFLLKIKDNSEITVKCPKSVQFQCGDYKCSVVDGRKLCIRVALDTKACLMDSICSDLASDIRSLSLKTPYDVLQGTPLTVTCSSCGATVSESVQFDRIRQMPAADWNHASEEWFCCAHGAQNEMLKSGTVAPRLNDCFFSDLFFLVKREVLSDKVRYDCEQNAVCRGCENIFGVQVESDVKLWTHRIIWVDSSDSTRVVYSQCEQDLMVTLIDHLSDDSFGANSRIVFVKPTKPPVYLYMAVIGTNLTLLRSTGMNSSANHKKVDEQSEIVCQGKRSRSGESEKRSRPNIIGKEDTQVLLKKLNVIKVSYKVVSGDSDETDQWADDVNVHLLHCAESFFDAILESITDSGIDLQPAVGSDELFGYIER